MEKTSNITVTKLKELLYLKICEISDNFNRYKNNETRLALLSDAIKLLDGNMDDVIVNKINLDLLLDNIFINDDRYNKKLNSILNKNYKTLSRGILYREDVIFNQDLSPYAILLEVGGVDNTIEEVNNSLEAFSLVLKEYLDNEELNG